MKKFNAGYLLVADPFLKDANFSRSVVLLTEVENNMAMGFLLNKLYPKKLEDLVEEFNDIHFPIYNGGPVQQDTLHFLHNRQDLIDDGNEIAEGIYWGGNFELALSLVKDRILTPRDIRFFIGYSGWDKNQLEQEFDENSWLLHRGKSKFIFHHYCDNLWKEVLNDMGAEFSKLSNYPIDPQLN